MYIAVESILYLGIVTASKTGLKFISIVLVQI